VEVNTNRKVIVFNDKDHADEACRWLNENEDLLSHEEKKSIIQETAVHKP
jgi:hypothetical protein